MTSGKAFSATTTQEKAEGREGTEEECDLDEAQVERKREKERKLEMNSGDEHFDRKW